MTKNDNNINIARISLIIFGIAIGIGIGIGIAKAQTTLPKKQSLQQHTLPLNELKASSLKDLKVPSELKASKELNTLSVSLLQNHLLESPVEENLLATHLNELSLNHDLDRRLEKLAVLKTLHGKLGLLDLTV